MDPINTPNSVTSEPEVFENDPVAEVREAAARRALEHRPTSPIWKWGTFLLLGSALAGFLSSESHRKQLISSKGKLEETLQIVEVERLEFHDAWKEQEQKSETLAERLDSVEKALSSAEQRSVTLMSEKAGLNGVITDLKKSLTTAIGDHQRTEASLNKVISSLEAKNTQLQASLSQETEIVASLQTQLDGITEQLRLAEASSKRLESDNEALQQRVASLTETLKAADNREAELRNRVTELAAANEMLTKTLSDQKRRLSEAQKELSANKVDLISERLASQVLQSKLDLTNNALAVATAELDAVVPVYKEVAEPAPANEESTGGNQVLGVNVDQVLGTVGQIDVSAQDQGTILTPNTNP